MPKRYYIIFALILFLDSCSIHGSFQGLYSYYYQTRSQIPGILVDADSVHAIGDREKTAEPKIYIINGSKLKDRISAYKEAVVYIWKPKCRGDFCYPLTALQEKCSRLNKELFIVAEYYDAEMMKLTYNVSQPICAIDTRYYRTNLTSKYLSKFLFDLTSRKNIRGSLLYFKNGLFLNSSRNLDSLFISDTHF